ncbi:glutamate--cysteine ligase [Marinicella sp. S1101]|uniref:glutamate--cysteine ligase n=1 Tax=Marinicella marina TaxID=2996016 RepID=UPI002260F47B|nr:glutamate--cysteine ligase [Marinicella marina]MCX7552421.1 glutamate--cysteine ligase [Marinicella marina]MDJ1139296.1 glutamate--cysteine ligase [Marinicella marina]
MKKQHIKAKNQLVDYLASGCKPKSEWKVGTEHEKFGFHRDNNQPLHYAEPGGIRDILNGLAEQFNWQPEYEGDDVIALKRDGCSITLEPGGQLELSGAPLADVHLTCSETGLHLKEVKAVAEPLGSAFLGMGFHPTAARSDIEYMPKGRYGIMSNYMPKVGSLGLDMMKRTCTIQANLDFSSEADMVKKFRVSLALQPIATALFANSPFTEGRSNGFVSYRSHIWTDTDADRCGIIPFVFEDGMGFERYVDYMLDVPMYFVYRDGKYIDAAGLSFRDFMAGKLSVLPGELPTMKDWEDHLTTAFPEVRLKKFLEMRGADGGPWRRICALPALWIGLLYDQEQLDAASEMVSDWSLAEHEHLRNEVPKLGLSTAFRGGNVRDLALQMLDMARKGLVKRAIKSPCGKDESIFLEPLQVIADTYATPAERKLGKYHGVWNKNLDELFDIYAY